MNRRELLGSVAALFAGVAIPEALRELVTVELDPLRNLRHAALPEWQPQSTGTWELDRVLKGIYLPAMRENFRRKVEALCSPTGALLRGIASGGCDVRTEIALGGSIGPFRCGVLYNDTVGTAEEPAPIRVERSGYPVEFSRQDVAATVPNTRDPVHVNLRHYRKVFTLPVRGVLPVDQLDRGALPL